MAASYRGVLKLIDDAESVFPSFINYRFMRRTSGRTMMK